MSSFRKIGLMFFVIVIGVLSIFVYMNNRLYYRAMRQDGQKKIVSLEKLNKRFPINDLAFYELGKSYLDLAVNDLSDPQADISSIRKAVLNLQKAIMINPSSPHAHYYLGQAVLQLNLFSPGEGRESLGEFRRAAWLAGGDIRLVNEVGRIFISQWSKLSAQDRTLTLEIIRKILGERDEEQTVSLLNTWDLNVGDYAIIEKILPADAGLYRLFARFLGEKSLAIEERLKYLALAEVLEFGEARRQYQSGEIQLFGYQSQAASGQFKMALDLLRRIRFYQSLTGEDLIERDEFTELMKSTLLNLAKSQIDLGAQLKDVEEYLREYLSSEDRTAKVGELEAYLRGRGVLSEKFQKDFEDLDRLAFELLLLYKQTKYQDIVNFGRNLEKSFVIVPEAKRPDYLKILYLIGDSLQKVDHLYDAGDIYQKARELEPSRLETLIKIRDNCNLLNNDAQKAKIEQDIERVVAPKEMDFKNLLLNRGAGQWFGLIFDGRRISLNLDFVDDKEGGTPLITVFFNGRVVWEDYLKASPISLNLETRIGQNELQIIPANRSVIFSKLTYQFDSPNSNVPIARRPK